MADDRNPVLRMLDDWLPTERRPRMTVTRRGVALVVGLVVLLVASRFGLTDLLATLLAVLVGLLWYRFGLPAGRSRTEVSRDERAVEDRGRSD